MCGKRSPRLGSPWPPLVACSGMRSQCPRARLRGEARNGTSVRHARSSTEGGPSSDSPNPNRFLESAKEQPPSPQSPARRPRGHSRVTQKLGCRGSLAGPESRPTPPPPPLTSHPVAREAEEQSVRSWEGRDSVQEVGPRGDEHPTPPESAAEAKCRPNCLSAPDRVTKIMMSRLTVHGKGEANYLCPNS